MTNLALKGRVKWTACRDPQSGYWIAVCKPLKQTVSGETWAELNESIGETLQLLFRELLEKDELASFLRNHGWKFDQPVPERRTNVRFDVPWQLVERRGAHVKEAALCS
jgi:hypothetical protein